MARGTLPVPPVTLVRNNASMSVFTAVLPVATLILGAVLAELAEARRYRRNRADDQADALRRQRGEAYQVFIRDVHTTTHLIGRSSPGCPQPLDGPAELAHAAADSEVSRDLYQLEIFANEGTLAAARCLRDAVMDFRAAVLDGAHYMDDAYQAALGHYQRARRAFLDEARTELLSGTAGA
jgi:hypothetical protein